MLCSHGAVYGVGASRGWLGRAHAGGPPLYDDNTMKKRELLCVNYLLYFLYFLSNAAEKSLDILLYGGEIQAVKVWPRSLFSGVRARRPVLQGSRRPRSAHTPT